MQSRINPVMKRLTVFSAAVAVMAAFVAGAFARSDPAPPAIASVGPLHVTYPGNMHRRYFSSCSFAVTGVRSGACVHGVVVASYPLKPNPELGASGASFQPDGVLFELYRSPSQEAYVVSPKLPLSLADFHAVGEGMHPRGEQRELLFRANGANDWAIAWIGKHATKSERDDLTGVIGSIQAAMPAAPRLPGHPLLVDRAGLIVFGPALHANAPCAHLLPPPKDAAGTVKRAVELAMPAFERRLKLDGRDPHVKVAPADRSGFSFTAGGCGRTAWDRSVVASVFLPHVRGASLSQHTFAVGRVRQGWVLWGMIH